MKQVRDEYAFASVMLFVLGAFNLIDGYILLRKSSLLENAGAFVAGDASTWGWVVIVWAALQIFAGYRLSTGVGKGLGIVITGTAMVLWFSMLFVAPFAAIIGVAINYSVMMALMRTGSELPAKN